MVDTVQKRTDIFFWKWDIFTRKEKIIHLASDEASRLNGNCEFGLAGVK